VSATVDDAVDLHLRPVAPADLAVELVGWRAPAGWRAAGVTAPASVARAGLPSGSGTAVLARPGGALVIGTAGDGPARAWTTPPGSGEGRLADLCRRAVGAATPPCPDPSRQAWAAAWLDRLVALAADRHPASSAIAWPEVAAAHPLTAILAPAAVPSPDDLARSAALPLARTSWDGLRRAVVAGQEGVDQLVGDVTRAEAAWLDAGSFGRRLLARQPPAGELLDALADLLPAALFAEVVTVASAWGVDRWRRGRSPGQRPPAAGDDE
jgi:hypothetical protein